jgi:hypothetical protein
MPTNELSLGRATPITRLPFNGTVDATGVVLGSAADVGVATANIPGYVAGMQPIQWEIRNTGDTNSLWVQPGDGTNSLTFTAESSPTLGDYDILAPGVGYTEPKGHPNQELYDNVAERMTLKIRSSAATTTFSGWVTLWEPDSA